MTADPSIQTGPGIVHEVVTEAVRALHMLPAARQQAGEPYIVPAITHHGHVEAVLQALGLTGFAWEWQSHRTAGPQTRNLRVTYEGVAA